MKYEYYDKFVNKKTRGRCDVTPIFANPEIFRNLISDLLRPFSGEKLNVIAGIEALGFVIGGAMSYKTGIPFAVVRKGGKLPGKKGTVIRTSCIDYTGERKTFEMSKGSIKNGDRVLVADEWIETGAQIRAAINLIERQGGKVAGITVLCAEKNKRTKDLFQKYKLRAICLREL